MEVASGLLDHCRPCSLSDDRQELGDDSSSLAMALLLEELPLVGSERFSFRSRPFEELLLLLRLILALLVLERQEACSDRERGCSGSGREELWALE